MLVSIQARILTCLCFYWCILSITCDVHDVKNVCVLIQDLEYTSIGYKCVFDNGNVYVYQGNENLKFIEFDTFSADSKLILVGHVDRIIIKRGSLDLCMTILLGNKPPMIPSITINNQKCDQLQDNAISPVMPTVSMDLPKLGSTFSKLLTESSKPGHVGTTTSTPLTTAAPMKDTGESSTPWIISFILSSVDIIKVLAGALITVLGVLLRFRHEFLRLLNNQNVDQQTQQNIPIVQQINQQQNIPIPIRPKRNRKQPQRFGEWQT